MKRLFPVVLLAVGACGDDTHGDPGPPDASLTPVTQALMVTGDFDQTGLMSKLVLDSMTMSQNITGIGAVSGDPVVRKIGSKIYVVNRWAGTSITVFDANTLTFLDQYGTGGGTNPQDVAVVGSKLYVPAMGTAGVVVLDAISLQLKTIDLSLLDPDERPDCVSAYAVGTKVYVSCGMLDEFYSARGPGKIVVIDSETDTATDTITLPATNPYNFIVQSPADSMFGGDLLVPMLPSFNDFSTGCIARVNTTSNTSTCAAGLDNADIGGTVIHADVAPDGKMLWMAVGTLDANFENPTGSLKGFDMTTGTLWEAALSPASQMIQDVAACPDGSVVVADGTFGTAGIRVYKGTAELTTAPLAIGMPPTYGNAIVCYATQSSTQ